jgi:hypothetical protein
MSSTEYLKIKKYLTIVPDGCINPVCVMDKSRPDFSFAAATNGLLFLWSAGAKTPRILKIRRSAGRKAFCSNASGCTTPTRFDTVSLKTRPPGKF